MFPHHYALVVGINYYPGISDLASPVKDANDFYQWLSTDGGVPPENIEKILGDHDADDVFMATPTAELINNGLRKLHKRVKAVLDSDATRWRDTRLYVFFSGHGIAPTGLEVALLMANADAGAFPHIPCIRYLDYYVRSQYFRELVIFADCCREEKELSINAPPFSENFRQMGTVSYMTGFATGDGTAAYEPPRVEGAPPQNSYFTGALLEALRGTNVASPGLPITDQTVADYICKVVPERSPKQAPRVVPDRANPIIFRQPVEPVIVRFRTRIHPPPGFSGQIELWKDLSTLVATWPAEGGTKELELLIGFYEARAQGAPDGSAFYQSGLFKIVKGDTDVQL